MPPRIGQKQLSYRQTFIRQWREHRGLSQDRLVERVRERVPTFSKSTLSRLERGHQAYTQPILEALAFALGCEPQDLLIRKPDSEIWSIMDTLQDLPESQQRQLLDIARTFRRTG